MKAGIPTAMRNGRMSRSRLEARWAAFFDLARWRYEYEPFDLPGWIPDFAIIGDDETVLVEVKPVFEFPKDTAEKIHQAAEAGGVRHPILILGAALPGHRSPLGDTCSCSGHIGWIQQRDYWNDDWHLATVFRGSLMDRPGLSSCFGRWVDHVNGTGCSKPYQEQTAFVPVLWAEAGNRVQWRARD
jgi:hypothetical protein